MRCLKKRAAHPKRTAPPVTQKLSTTSFLNPSAGQHNNPSAVWQSCSRPTCQQGSVCAPRSHDEKAHTHTHTSCPLSFALTHSTEGS